MMEIFDVDSWRQMLVQSLEHLGGVLAAFLPRLAAALLILAVGWGIARLIEAGTQRLLHRIGLDHGAGPVHIPQTFQRAGISTSPSRALSRLAYWLVFLTALLLAVEILGLASVEGTLERFSSFAPDVVAAILLLLFGLLAGRFVRNVVSSGAVAAGVTAAPRLGAAAQATIVGLVVVIALEQIGVETELVVTVVTVVAASLVLTVGLAVALGARPVVTHILAGHFLRQSLPPGHSVVIDGRRGVVDRVGPVDTLLRDGERGWSIPNAKLLETIVER